MSSTVLPLRSASASRWPSRLALLAAVSAVPLFAFGGSVTSMEAGMAVQGWLNAEGHFLPFFPVEKWLRDPGTFVEHTHRLFGMLVGLFAVLCVVATFLSDERRAARWTALGALLAVCAQGALGGFRVLEDSPRLAFLHGALGQAVFALLFCAAAILSPAYRAAGGARAASGDDSEGVDGGGLRRHALLALVLTYIQVALGAWYRHGLRPTPAAGNETRLGLHFLGAFLVLGVVAALIGRLERTGEPRLAGAARWLKVLLGAQLALGFAAWMAFRPGGTGTAELILSVAHVVCGALLLAQVAVAALWSRRLFAPDEAGREALAPERAGGAA
jgi:cytochrome c oxidase assembly protein subunit 15